MDLDLYNFHLRSPSTPSTCQLLQSSAMSTVPTGCDQGHQHQYCHSWNDGACAAGPLGDAVFATPAKGVMGNIPRSTAPSSHLQATGPAPVPLQGKGGGSELPLHSFVHSVNSIIGQALGLLAMTAPSSVFDPINDIFAAAAQSERGQQTFNVQVD